MIFTFHYTKQTKFATSIYAFLQSFIILTGKGLSTNDFTDADKSKLDSLENYDDAEVKSQTALNRSTLGYQRKNLLENKEKTRTISGVTFTVNEDKTVTVSGTATADITSYAIKIYKALNGSGKLVISTDPDEYLDVILSPIAPDPVALLAAEISIPVTARPFAYSVSPTEINLTGATNYAEVENRGTVFSAPEFRLKGSGDVTITVNGADFIIKIPSDLNSQEIIIDCDSQVAYYVNGDNKIAITHRTYNNFPLLHEGKNYIKYTGDLASFSVNVKERWY